MPHWLAVNFVIFVLGVAAGNFSEQCREAWRAERNRVAIEDGTLCAASLIAIATTILWL
jgi:hypothetical protein